MFYGSEEILRFVFSIFMKNVLLAHENSVAAAYHSVPEREGLISPTN